MRRSRPALATALIAVATACPPKPPKVIGIEIVPAAVQVTSDPGRPTTFVLEARLWTGSPTDRRSITADQGLYTLTWTKSPGWLTQVPGGSGYQATFSVPPGQAGSGQVTVEAGGKVSTSVPITVTQQTLLGEDAAKANYVADKPPDAVVVNGIPAAPASPCTGRLDAFVARAMLGKLVAACNGVAGSWGAGVLAVDRRMLLEQVSWTPNPPDDIVNPPTPDAPLRLPIALRIMVGDPALLQPAQRTQLWDNVLKQAKADVDASNLLLKETRAGVQLVIDNDANAMSMDQVDIPSCDEGDATTESNDDARTLLNVYYVNTIGLGGFRGLTCAWHTPTRLRDVIYVSYDQHSPTTLIHELGHALGLTLPGQGHADMIAGLDATNIMTSGENDLDPGGRRHLSVGQVFRMNAEPASWLNTAVDLATNTALRGPTEPRVPCQCGAADPAGLCPRLADDVALPSQAPGTAQAWDCVDELQLIMPDETEDPPVALVAGRPWRAAPTGCGTDLHGLPVKRWVGSVFIEIDNLTRSGECPTWIALFSTVHAVRHLKPNPSTFGWTQAADRWVLLDQKPLPDLYDLKVHMYFKAGDVNAKKQDAGRVEKIFGASTRSGLALSFEDHAGTNCPTADPGAHALSVCYTSSTSGEAILAGNGRIEVALRTPTTVPHFVGRALGLEPIKTSDPTMPNNIMQPVPGNRGDKLTLGQIFRINAHLNPLLPECKVEPCPALDADFPP